MKRLRIDLAELAAAFEHGGSAVSYYLDTESGEVLPEDEESRRMLDGLYDTYGGAERRLDLEAVLAMRALPNWQKEKLRTAHRIDTGFGSRYLQVPESDSLDGYADMKAFIETVPDQSFADTLWSAIQGKGALRRFKDALATRPADEQRWLAFKDAHVRARLAAWLDENGVQSDETGT